VQTTFYPSLSGLSVYRPDSADGGRPRAEQFADRHIALPFSPSLSGDQIELVASELGDALLQ
jgi:dTDP-4-amino-4,6-dideoxygalactose transaminase